MIGAEVTRAEGMSAHVMAEAEVMSAEVMSAEGPYLLSGLLC